MTADIYVWFALVSLTGSLRSQIKFTQFSLSLSSFFIIWEVHVSKSSHRKLETMMIVLSVKTSHCGIIKTGRNFYFLKESKKEKEKCSECNITFKVLFNENNHIGSNFLSILQEYIYIFLILRIHFYEILTLVYLFYTFIQ